MSPVNGSIATIPPFTFGYCFKTHLSLIFFTKIISPKLCLSIIDLFFDKDHFIEFKLNVPEIFIFSNGLLNLISESLNSLISATFQLSVGSSLNLLTFFFQLVSLSLLVIGPLQPYLLSYSSIPFLNDLIASI